MVEIDFLADKRPVMLYDIDKYDALTLSAIYANLKRAYPDIIALPYDIQIRWWTKEELEKVMRILE